jgi:nitrous oxide reductase accessory protein NosL
MVKIYFLHNGNNIPFYVGETSQPLKYRLSHHKRKLGNKIYIELIEEVKDWRFWEKHYISLFKSWGFKLTNKNNGGGGCEKGIPKHTIESRKKIGASKKGKTLSNETKLKQSISNKGISRNKGNSFAKGHILPLESISNIVKKRKKIIYQLDKQDNIIKEWPSIKEASLELKIQSSDINNCCKGKNKTAGGYKFKYKS